MNKTYEEQERLKFWMYITYGIVIFLRTYLGFQHDPYTIGLLKGIPKSEKMLEQLNIKNLIIYSVLLINSILAMCLLVKFLVKYIVLTFKMIIKQKGDKKYLLLLKNTVVYFLQIPVLIWIFKIFIYNYTSKLTGPYENIQLENLYFALSSISSYISIVMLLAFSLILIIISIYSFVLGVTYFLKARIISKL